MYATVLSDANFPAALLALDEELAFAAQAAGCRACGGRLHWARYPRKPRGGSWQLGPEHDVRHSFCCAWEGCRRSTTPRSVRLVGRRVYIAAVVVLGTVLRHGVTALRVRQVSELFGANRRTLERWRRWWADEGSVDITGLVPPVDRAGLPGSLLERFVGEPQQRLVALLLWLRDRLSPRSLRAGWRPAEVARGSHFGRCVGSTAMADTTSTAERWARFRFAVIGPLHAAPPEGGQLRAALADLARKSFTHPVSGQPTRFAFSTFERWFYAASRDADPVTQLRRRVRKDAGHRRSIGEDLGAAIRRQYADHPRWSYPLHYDNLKALCEMDASLGPLPSYATVRRYMKSQGWIRQRRKTDHRIASGPREVRSFEHPFAHALWHLDFHYGSRNVLLSDGRWVTPKLLAVLDDHSRLCCHAQWYLDESAEELVHGLCQAFMKRGLPRSLMMDNGSAMVAAETMQGLERLGVHAVFTQPESPYQNGKQETFFAPVEGRLMAMREGVQELDLDLLNQATLAWVEGDYHRKLHEALGQTPLERLARARNL